MNAKALLIPIAAFAVTVTGANAFDSDVLKEAGLNDNQISAFEEAHTLRKSGDKEAARDIIVDAGIDQDTLEGIREAMRAHHDATRTAIDTAVENEDYDAFLEAIADSPLADIINTEADFKLFVEAHQLRETGDREAAKAIMDDLGFEKPPFRHHGGHKGPHPEQKDKS